MTSYVQSLVTGAHAIWKSLDDQPAGVCSKTDRLSREELQSLFFNDFATLGCDTLVR